ncbi:SH3 domain-containing protein [Parvicella tangerina]|nr:SH3 domain-containing protein [Parvicella tangerina]
MKNILTLILAIIVNSCFSQYGLGIIVDPDGYVNVRSNPSIDNNIISTIPNETPVFCYDRDGNWVPVEVYIGDSLKQGFVYFDRIQFLDSLEVFEPSKEENHVVSFHIGPVTIIMKEQDLSVNELNILDCEDEHGYCYFAKDGKRIWGTDGGRPYRGYQYITINSNEYSSISPEISHYFQPNLTYSSCAVHNSTIYLSASNSDGAGGYIVVWTIKGNQIVDHHAFYGF